MSLLLRRQELLRLLMSHHPQKLERVVAAVIRTTWASYDALPCPSPNKAQMWQFWLILMCVWGDHIAKEYDHIATQILADMTSTYPHLHPHPVTAEHIRHTLLLHYSTWHSRITRREQNKITVGSGESISMMDILEWGGKVLTTTVPFWSSHSTIPRTRHVDMSLSMQIWIAKVEEFNSLALLNRQISEHSN